MSDDEEVATFTVLRTSDAKKEEITIPLSNTLQQLKDILGHENHFGPLVGTTQRIFHMGRELKSGGRSLSALALGRFNNHILHLHVIGKPSLDSSSSTTSTTATKRRRNHDSSTTSSAATTTTTTATSTTTASTSESARRMSTRTNPRGTNGRATGTHLKTDSVIDLLSDSDDEDALEVVESPAADSSAKRRRG